MIKRILILLLISGQLLAQNNEYLFDLSSANPSATALKNNSISLFYSAKLIGIEKSPVYQHLNYQSRFSENTAIGIHVLSETKGESGNTAFHFSYSHQLKIIQQFKLSLGLQSEFNSSLIDLSGINVLPGNISLSSYNLSNYKSSMNDIEVLVNEYDIKKQKLEKKITHYNSIISKLKDGKVNVNYYLMNIWIIILFVVGYASFFSVIEEKESLNHISRIILFLFLIFVAYFIFKNVYLYFSGYQINYNPLK